MNQDQSDAQRSDPLRPNEHEHTKPAPQNQRHIGETILARKLFWSKLAIFTENLWLKLWAPAIVIALFTILSLFHFWPLLSPLLHRFCLAMFAMGLLASFYPFLSLRWPTDTAALKRLDKFGALPHQPAQAFKDNLDPSQSTNQTRALWLLFKDRLVEKIKLLRVSPPQPDTSKKDPYALRMVMMLALALGLFIEGGNIKSLISKGLTIPPMLSTDDMRIDAWVTPPAYTAKAPILIADGGKNDNAEQDTGHPTTAFEVPQNSTLTIRLNGKNVKYVELESNNKSIKPENLKGKNQNRLQAPKSSAEKSSAKSIANSREFHIKLAEQGAVKLNIDKVPLRHWAFNIIDDMPPIIGLIEAPSRAKSGALKLKYRVADDYGVIGAKAHIQDLALQDPEQPNQAEQLTEDERPLGEAPEFPLNLPSTNTTEAEGETFKDLTSHPWAGFNVTLFLTAEDEGTNISQSPHINITLPEYNFTKQIAKDIISLRKQLIIAPQESPLIAHGIDRLLFNTTPFEKDLSLYLGLRVSASRLSMADTRKEKEDIAKLLYELARHAEDGDLSQAEQDLRTAQEELRKALQSNASESEIEKRIEELRKALQKYMQALAKQQQNQNPNENQQNQNAQNLDPKDFEQMLKTIEELAKSGSKDLARQMLSQLQNMLENLQTGKNPNQQKQQQTAKELEELGKILRDQQKLMDQTFQQRRQNNNQNRQNSENNQNQQQGDQQQQQSQSGKPQNQQGNNLNQQQQALRQQLQQLMNKLQKQKGKNAQSLENADRAMGRAGELLKEKDLGNALSQEGQALDQLRKGMEQMAREMQGMKGEGGSQKAGGKDPLGRPQSNKGMDTSESTKVPDKIDIQRAREILRNLQDKLSDPNRPAPELDYIERLLKRF